MKTPSAAVWASSIPRNAARIVFSYIGTGVSLKLASRMIPRLPSPPTCRRGHVVAAHVLDDLAAALGDPAVGLDDFHADDGVSWVSEVPFERSAYACGERTSDGRPAGNGRIDGKHLAVTRERFGDLPHCQTCLESRCEVGVVVGDYPVDTGHVYDFAGTGRYAAEIDARTAASWEDGGAFGVGARRLRGSTDPQTRGNHFEWLNAVDGPAGGHCQLLTEALQKLVVVGSS